MSRNLCCEIAGLQIFCETQEPNDLNDQPIRIVVGNAKDNLNALYVAKTVAAIAVAVFRGDFAIHQNEITFYDTVHKHNLDCRDKEAVHEEGVLEILRALGKELPSAISTLQLKARLRMLEQSYQQSVRSR